MPGVFRVAPGRPWLRPIVLHGYTWGAARCRTEEKRNRNKNLFHKFLFLLISAWPAGDLPSVFRLRAKQLAAPADRGCVALPVSGAGNRPAAPWATLLWEGQSLLLTLNLRTR